MNIKLSWPISSLINWRSLECLFDFYKHSSESSYSQLSSSPLGLTCVSFLHQSSVHVFLFFRGLDLTTLLLSSYLNNEHRVLWFLFRLRNVHLSPRLMNNRQLMSIRDATFEHTLWRLNKNIWRSQNYFFTSEQKRTRNIGDML